MAIGFLIVTIILLYTLTYKVPELLIKILNEIRDLTGRYEQDNFPVFPFKTIDGFRNDNERVNKRLEQKWEELEKRSKEEAKSKKIKFNKEFSDDLKRNYKRYFDDRFRLNKDEKKLDDMVVANYKVKNGQKTIDEVREEFPLFDFSYISDSEKHYKKWENERYKEEEK